MWNLNTDSSISDEKLASTLQCAICAKYTPDFRLCEKNVKPLGNNFLILIRCSNDSILESLG